jgi:hypothetical protein
MGAAAVMEPSEASTGLVGAAPPPLHDVWPTRVRDQVGRWFTQEQLDEAMERARVTMCVRTRCPCSCLRPARREREHREPLMRICAAGVPVSLEQAREILDRYRLTPLQGRRTRCTRTTPEEYMAANPRGIVWPEVHSLLRAWGAAEALCRPGCPLTWRRRAAAVWSSARTRGAHCSSWSDWARLRSERPARCGRGHLSLTCTLLRSEGDARDLLCGVFLMAEVRCAAHLPAQARA